MAECTIYDKLRYIAETKDLIKAAIEAQDVKVLESATFRQYAEYITQIRKVSSVNGMQGDVTITAADLGALTEIPSEYITETELNEKGYLTAVPDVYITEDELSSQLADKVSQNGLNEAIAGVRNNIPTNVSQLTNDSGYITLNEVPKVDLSGYALKSEIPDISVKQDKLTAGNGISITDNVISLDYEYDLFEVVQSLPTENISDNKVYLLLDSNGSEGNTYVEYLYVNGQWEELGKFKVNIDLSGYATEDWVNSQGFLKEHQDISNLATKAELNAKQDVISDLEAIRSGAAKGATALQTVPSGYATEQWVNGQGFLKEHQDISNLATKQELATKQDVITDLDTIRSGAAKGATALQSVPSTYAKKTDILTAKTDTRYTTYDVQNPVLSGKTILLQNEVTDSRKYHTLGYEKTITTSVPVQKYINITRNYNGVPSMDTDIESGIDFHYNEENGVGMMGGDIPFTLDKINAVTNLLHYEVSYADNSGETIVDDVIYDPNTKLLSVSDGRFSLAQIRKSDNGQHIFGGNTDGNEYLENGRWYYNFEQHPLQEGVHLIFEPYYSSNLYWNFSVTINGLFYQEGSVTTDDKPERLNDYIRYANNVKAYILTDKNTTFKTINGQQITGNGDIKIDTNVDLTPYATKEELNTKQDTISDLDTIRSGAAKGATALQSVPEEYAKKTDIPDISTKQDVISDLETIRSGAAKGATALQEVPTGYATEQWVNSQGFLKEHQDISNLATKAELATKQDVISDLETIRSGAELGATALQSVPDTYALKSEILSAKTDERYTDYDVQNPVLSGNTIVLQNEVTDSRKYHTIGYDKTAETTEIGQVIKYSRFNGEFDENGSPIIDTNFDNHQTIPLDFSHITDDGDQIIIHYTGSFANNDYETGTSTEGDSFEATITYNRNTKQLNASDDANVTIYHFTRSDTSEYIFDPNNKHFDCYMLPDDAYLIWDIGSMSSPLYYRYNVSTQGKLFVGETTTTTQTSRLPQNKNEFFRYENGVKAYILTDKNTTFKTINGQQITGNGNIELATKYELNEKQNVIPDLYSIRIGAEKGATALQSVPSEYAKKTDIPDISTKQDVIPDLEAIRSGAAKGETALQSVPNTYALKSEIPDISVKQDKLTAGNGISITDNVISLDYEYDLFEVVPSLPTENINDNKIYLVYQSDGDGNNLYIEYIYAAGHWEELGKFKANVDLSGYATEQWVNSQGFLKEHQDISNLATKEELNTKQDTISDLDSIRSGAAKGATALQSVPEEYAKKTDIPDISTKQDVIPDLEAIRSGASLGATALQSVPSGYATEQWVNEQGFLKEHQDISNLATKSELNAKQDVISDLETIRSGAALGSTALQSVPDTYALKSEIPDITTKQDTLVSGTNIKTINGTSLLGSGDITIDTNVDLSGYATEQWVNEQGFIKEHQDISNLATKEELNAKQDTINDLETIRSGAAKGATALQSVPSEYVTETELNNKGYLTSVPDTYALKSEIPDITTKQDTLVSGTNIKTINGESILGSGNITIECGSGNVDLSNYYTKTETNELVNPKLEQVTLTQAEYDALQTKQDNVLYIISDAEDLKFKTINGQQITGEGNIEIEASANNVPTVQTTVQGTTSNYIYSNVSNSNNKYGVVTDISNFITYSTDKATIKTYTRYWGQESSNTYQNLSINAATTSQAGLMSSSDKTKLDGIDLTIKQDTLVSGTNIKTVNGISLLGEGNITISGEGGADLSGYYTKAEIDAMIGGASATITQINNLVG